MIEGVTASLLASAAWETGKKGIGLTRKFLKKKFGRRLNDEEYITISEEINEIPIDKKGSKEEIEELIRDNKTIMKIIKEENNKVEINVKENSGTVAGNIEGNFNQTNNKNIYHKKEHNKKKS